MNIRFSARSEVLAELGVEGVVEPFSLVAASPDLYRLGLADAPLFEIERRPSPDEPWNITPLPHGRMLDTAGTCVSGELAKWVPSVFEASLASLIARLPDGEYLVIRHRGPVLRGNAFLLGNEWVEDAGEYFQVLLDEDDVFAGALGNRFGEMPDLTFPLLGLSVLNYTGDQTPRAALFFSTFSPSADAPAVASELLMVLPRTGPLVFDNMEHYSTEDSARDRQLWAEKHAELFATKLASVSGE